MHPDTRHRERIRRALLFSPGPEWRKIEKASGLGVDSVIIDLEDAAALSRKEEARQTAARALASLDFGRTERLVRINPIGSGLEEADLGITGLDAATAPDGFVIPKVESGDDIRHIIPLIERIERQHQRSLCLLPIIESARGVVELKGIASADPRVSALIFGAEDFCGDVGARRSPEGLEVFYAKSAVVVHAAAFGLQAIDTPFVDFRDLAGLTRDTAQARDFGYTGKLAIHPNQVAPIVDAFTPSQEEVDEARALIAAHDEHQREGRGVFGYRGKMVDMPMIRAAKRVLRAASDS